MVSEVAGEERVYSRVFYILSLMAHSNEQRMAQMVELIRIQGSSVAELAAEHM